MIEEEGIVSTGAGLYSPHPLQVMAKSQNRVRRSPEHGVKYRRTKGEVSSVDRVLSSHGKRRAIPGLSRHSSGTWKVGISPMPPWSQ